MRSSTGGDGVAAEPPEHLDAEAQALWTGTRRELAREATWKDSYGPLLERYVRCDQIAREARAVLEGEASLVPGGDGMPCEHPLFETVREAELDAETYAASLAAALLPDEGDDDE